MGRAALPFVRPLGDKGLVAPRDKELAVRFSLLILPALAALALVGGSPAAGPKPDLSLGPTDFVVGASEDQVLGFDDGGAAMDAQMTVRGLAALRMSVDYEPSQPTTIQQEAQLHRAVDAAIVRSFRVLLSISPGHSTDVTSDPNGAKRFAAYAALVAKAFPGVTDFIIGNEPNLGNFWFPTFNADGSIASAKTYEAALAASYDALKNVNSNIDVIGIAVSPKGDDRPGSARNTISPVRFIKAVGDAYRKSRRTKPIMDNVSLHPYPNVNTDPPDKGAAWPQVSIANLDRAQQTFWDAFNGTAQPTFAEPGGGQPGGAAPVRWILDEAGWQTDTRGLPGYHGEEKTPTIDEGTQARYYAQIVQRASCDPHVASLLFFHWIDEADRDRLQSGLVRANGSMKPAANAVGNAIGAGCTGAQITWRHTKRIIGAGVTWKPKAGFLFFAKAFEDATYMAKATPTKSALKKAARLGKKLRPVTAKGKVKAYLAAGVKFRGITLKNAGDYTYSVKISAAINPKRTVTLKTKKLKKPDIEL
jgi:hypothetical protein